MTPTDGRPTVWSARYFGVKCRDRSWGLAMYRTSLILLLFAASLCGCSILAYTPVVAVSLLGLNKTDLSDNIEFKDLTNRPFSLAPIEGLSWQLKKIDGGRHHVERASNSSEKEVICELIAGKLVIDEIFDDSINGGVFYSATVNCSGQTYNTPLNRWSESLRISMKFIDGNT